MRRYEELFFNNAGNCGIAACAVAFFAGFLCFPLGVFDGAGRAHIGVAAGTDAFAGIVFPAGRKAAG